MSLLKYYNATAPLRKTPKESYQEDYNAMYNLLVDNAPNVFESSLIFYFISQDK